MKRIRWTKAVMICTAAAFLFFVLIFQNWKNFIGINQLLVVLEEKGESCLPKVRLQLGENKREIEAFEAEDGEWYFFLPAGVSCDKIKIKGSTAKEYQEEKRGERTICITEIGGGMIERSTL